VARARSTEAVTTSTEVTAPGEPSEKTVPPTGGTTVPLSGATWTQNADELNRVVVRASITTTLSAMCTKGYFEPEGLGQVSIREDGREITRVGVQPSAATVQTVIPQNESQFQFEPGKATVHTLTATAIDGCGALGGKGGGHFKINSVAIDVIGIR
jgi:hypothetical protein